MTKTTRSFPERRWPHYASYAVPALVGGAILIGAASPWRVTSWNPLDNLHHSAGLFSWASLASLGYVAALWAAIYVSMLHTSRPCLVCAARLPLDPQAATERARPLLRLHHRSEPWLGYRPMLAYMAGVFLLPPGWPLNIWMIVAMSALLGVLVAATRHEKLQPWCPWCRRDDGGEDERMPEPDPSVRMPA